MLNVFENRLKVVQQSAGAQFDADLTRGVNHHSIRLEVTGTCTITNDGTTNYTLIEDGFANLLQNIRVNHDGFDYVKPMKGRDLLLLNRRTSMRPSVPTVPTGAAGATNFIVSLQVPFSPEFVANPYDLFLPAMKVEQQLKIFGEWAADLKATTLTGGDRTVAFTNVQVEIVEVYSVAAKKPQYIPVLGANDSTQFTAANAELNYLLTTSRRVLAHLVQMRQGALAASQGGINSILLSAGNVRQWNNVSFSSMKQSELRKFIGVPTTEVGTLLLSYVNNGKLGTILDPKTMGSNPLLQFNVNAPTGNPGVIRVVEWELAVRPGITVVEQP